MLQNKNRTDFPAQLQKLSHFIFSSQTWVEMSASFESRLLHYILIFVCAQPMRSACILTTEPIRRSKGRHKHLCTDHGIYPILEDCKDFALEAAFSPSGIETSGNLLHGSSHAPLAW